MRELFNDEVLAYMSQYQLPPLPDYYDGPDFLDLVLFREHDASVTLTQCALEDALEYCNREDTHGAGWFVGYRE